MFKRNPQKSRTLFTISLIIKALLKEEKCLAVEGWAERGANQDALNYSATNRWYCITYITGPNDSFRSIRYD